eukprot:TRINITY_DN26476_c0_g1_i1.p1 TRINITY_DN26476_c0_g1~~TRINITY_DN26476_c0_g1_i1.p1  ORF type:complete len:308 (-),score=84.77 TRINITY_DN26476_c0_g1_i1:34-957(-)
MCIRDRSDSNKTLLAFESYVLFGNSLDAAFQHLIKGSESYYDLYYLDLLKKKGANLSAEEKSQFEEYLESNTTEWAAKLRARYDFLKYTADTPEAEKQELVDQINKKHIRQTFDYQKPASCGLGNSEKAKDVKDVVEVKAVSWEEEIERVVSEKENGVNFWSLEVHGKRKVPLNKLTRLDDFIGYIESLEGEIVTVPQKPLFDRLKSEITSRNNHDARNSSKIAKLVSKLTKILSLEQLDKLVMIDSTLMEDENFFVAYLKRKMHAEIEMASKGRLKEERKEGLCPCTLRCYPVSYTHLTLPTIYSV